MKSSIESIALFCKYFADKERQQEQKYIDYIKRYHVKVSEILHTLRDEAHGFNNGKENSRSKLKNPNKALFFIFDEDLPELAQIYYESIFGKNGS